MKVGVIIPDRGDRPELLKQCIKRIVHEQTLSISKLALIDYPPWNNQVDITARYRSGYNYLRNSGLDVIALMENDEWYSPTYLEEMVKAWEANGRPDIFGTNYTIYYHLRLRAWFTMHHNTRSSAMSTLIKPDMDFNWCPDHEPYTDIHLWRNAGLKGVTFNPGKHLCIGMKHGVGLCGGRNHTNFLHRFINKDEELQWLEDVVGGDVGFYREMSNKLRMQNHGE